MEPAWVTLGVRVASVGAAGASTAQAIWVHVGNAPIHAGVPPLSVLHVCAPAVWEKPLLHVSNASDASTGVASYSRFSVYEYAPPLTTASEEHCFGWQIGAAPLHFPVLPVSAMHEIVGSPTKV